jgi:hypothetical protein
MARVTLEVAAQRLMLSPHPGHLRSSVSKDAKGGSNYNGTSFETVAEATSSG